MAPAPEPWTRPRPSPPCPVLAMWTLSMEATYRMVRWAGGAADAWDSRHCGLRWLWEVGRLWSLLFLITFKLAYVNSNKGFHWDSSIDMYSVRWTGSPPLLYFLYLPPHLHPFQTVFGGFHYATFTHTHTHTCTHTHVCIWNILPSSSLPIPTPFPFPLQPIPSPRQSSFYTYVPIVVNTLISACERKHGIFGFFELGLSCSTWWSLAPSIFLQTTRFHSSWLNNKYVIVYVCVCGNIYLPIIYLSQFLIHSSAVKGRLIPQLGCCD
jgi:hypothetical protein